MYLSDVRNDKRAAIVFGLGMGMAYLCFRQIVARYFALQSEDRHAPRGGLIEV